VGRRQGAGTWGRVEGVDVAGRETRCRAILVQMYLVRVARDTQPHQRSRDSGADGRGGTRQDASSSKHSGDWMVGGLSITIPVEISTYAVVLSILDRDPGALLQPSPLLPTAGFIFIAQVVLRAALIFWTMVQLFLTARKLPVQPNTLTDHSAELLGGKALQLIKDLDTDHADLPMIFQAYAASVETAARGTGGLLGGWGPFRKRADAVTSSRRERWVDLIATLGQFSTVKQEQRGSLPAPAAGELPVAANKRVERQIQSALERRREFMERHEARFVQLEGGRGEWLGAADVVRIARRRADGKPSLSEDRARKMVRAIGNQKKTAGGRMMYVATFDQVMRALVEADLLDEESLVWWTNYRAVRQPVDDTDANTWGL
jgi:hypothetical protein